MNYYDFLTDREDRKFVCVANDIEVIHHAISSSDYEWISMILCGEGYKPYNNLSDKEVEALFNEVDKTDKVIQLAETLKGEILVPHFFADASMQSLFAEILRTKRNKSKHESVVEAKDEVIRRFEEYDG